MRKRVIRIAVTVLCILLVILLVLTGLAWYYLNSKLDKVSRGDGIDYTQPIEDTSILGDAFCSSAPTSGTRNSPGPGPTA